MKKYFTLAVFVSGVLAVDLHAQSLGLVITNGLSEASGIAVDAGNNYYITDSGHNRIVKYTPTGAITNLAGTEDGSPGAANGKGIFASFSLPQGIVFSAARGGLVVADSANNLIRLIALDGTVTTLAGSLTAGNVNGAGAAAQFNDPVGLAADAAGNIYIADLGNSAIRKLDLANAVTTVATGFYRPAALAFDNGSGNIFVADSGNNAIKLISGGVVTLIAGSGFPTIYGAVDRLIGTNALFNHPRGLLWVGGPTGLLVSDTDNGLVRQVYANPTLGAGIYSTATYATNATGVPFVKPVGIAQDANGNFLVVDQGTGATDLSKLWIITVGQALPPVTAPQIGALTLTNDPLGNFFLDFSQIVGTATYNNDTTIGILTTDPNTGVQTVYTLGATTNNPAPPPPGTTPPVFNLSQKTLPPTLAEIVIPQPDVTIQAYSSSQGRVPSPVARARVQFQCAAPNLNGTDPSSFTLSDITANAQLWYTTDGSTPTNQGPSLLYAGGVLNVVNGTNDVVFNVIAFKAGYSASGVVSHTFHFTDIQNSFVGFTRDFKAGIGATVLLPVEVKLNSTNVLKSVQFRVEVTPIGAAPAVSTQMRNVVITTNDFVQLTPPATNAPSSSTYTAGTTTGVSIAYLGQSTGFNASGSMVVALIAVPIPATAAVGQQYTIALVQPSGTSDAGQTAVAMAPFASHLITVTNVPYSVGDSAPGAGYNAGDFGNGNLNNNDVNNALAASMGLRVPFSFSDAFDAMDAFPVDTAGSVGGDGQIRFLDWQIILQRALRLDTNNWIRLWSAGGVRTSLRTNLNSSPSLPASSSSADLAAGLTLAGLRLQKVNAQLGAVSQGNVNPGGVVNVPVYVNVAPGSSLAGLQFRAIIQPLGDAPALASSPQFTAPASLPAPIVPLLPPNQVAAAWPVIGSTSLNPALQSSNALGVVSFTIPASAQINQLYSVSIVSADGAPNLSTQYDFATSSAFVSVASPVVQSVTPAVNGFKVSWFGEAGQSYVVESSGDFLNWTVVGKNLVGSGTTLEFTDPNTTSNTQFYRVRSQ